MPLKPVRNIRPGSRAITGKHPSQKTGKMHPFESSLERDFLILLEYDDTVEDYGVQPVTIHYSHKDKPSLYTPDVEVHFNPETHKKPLLCEIKYEAELQAKKGFYEPKFLAANEYAFGNGYQFKVFTEKYIRTEYLENIKFLSRYHNSPVKEAYFNEIMLKMSEATSITPQQLLTHQTQEENGKLLFAVWQLLSKKIICCNMKQRITMTTELWSKTELQ